MLYRKRNEYNANEPQPKVPLAIILVVFVWSRYYMEHYFVYSSRLTLITVPEIRIYYLWKPIDEARLTAA